MGMDAKRAKDSSSVNFMAGRVVRSIIFDWKYVFTVLVRSCKVLNNNMRGLFTLQVTIQTAQTTQHKKEKYIHTEIRLYRLLRVDSDGRHGPKKLYGGRLNNLAVSAVLCISLRTRPSAHGSPSALCICSTIGSHKISQHSQMMNNNDPSSLQYDHV